MSLLFFLYKKGIDSFLFCGNPLGKGIFLMAILAQALSIEHIIH